MVAIVYFIHPERSEKDNTLVIEIVEVEKEGIPLHPLSANHPLTPSTLGRLCTTQDQAVLDFLIQAELQFQCHLTGRTPRAESTSFRFIHIEQNQAIEALKLLASTHKLYFKNKQLVADFFGKVEFYYQIERLDSHKIHISGRLKWRDNDLAIQACDFIGVGKPHWFIRGFSLKVITTQISWKHLKQAYDVHPWILEGPQKQSFLENLDVDDPDHPQTIVIGGTFQDLFSSPYPLPFLILKDRVGAFADLWMDYGQGCCIAFHEPFKELKGPSGALIKRQLDKEKSWEQDFLETDFVRKEVTTSHYYCPVNKVAKSLTFLLEMGWPIRDWKGNQVRRQNGTDLTIDQAQQTLIVKGKIHYENHAVNVVDVIGAFNRRERFVQLAPDQVGLLPDHWGQTGLQELAEEGEVISQEIKVKRSHLGTLSSLLDQARLSPALVNLKEKLDDFTHIPLIDPGEAFSGQLRPYQQQGLSWLSFLVAYHLHGILADEMGLGKTVQVLALLSRLPQDSPHLIIMPTSLLFNWKNEVERFLPGIIPYLHHGPQRAKTKQELEGHRIILTSYSTLRLDLPLLQNLSYQSVILDEAQVIKNAHTQTAQAIYHLEAQFRLSITGTPLENHLNELWSHFRFLIPDLFGEEETFMAELQAASSDNRYLQRIKKKIAPFILRRKKEEVAKDLPEKIEQVVWVEMNEAQRDVYDHFLASVRGNLLKKIQIEGTSKYRLEILEAILRLRQICCHPLLVSSLEDELTATTSAKMEALEEDIETAIKEKRKVLVYSQFTSMLKLLTKLARERGWSYVYLDGSTTNREKVVSQFQDDPAISLFFISLKAGGVGLNLTAADYVFLYDPWWNEAVEEQAINRAHRIGRQQTVIAKRFVTVESIEEKMMKLKAAKRWIIEEALESDATPLNLTVEDLYGLFR